MEIGYMEPGVLGALPEGVLFYPCCYHDLKEPISRFAPAVKEFWFVDMRYHYDVSFPIDIASNQRLCDSAKLIFQESELDGILHINCISIHKPAPTRRQCKRRQNANWSEPVDVVCHCNLRTDSDAEITVHLRRGCGLKCLEKHEFEHVSVFFYRGDSPGQSCGGSGHFWLKYSGVWFTQLLVRMPNNSLLVTDGSNSGHCMGRHLCPDSDRGSWRSRGKADMLDDIETEFEEGGHRYRLVGRVSNKIDYGPTCVWQYTNVASDSP